MDKEKIVYFKGKRLSENYIEAISDDMYEKTKGGTVCHKFKKKK